MKLHENSQRGAALILSLLMLLILSLLAISSMQNTVMQERMVSAEREGMVSLEIAESGLRDAEIFLDGVGNLTEFDGTDGLYGLLDNAPDPLDANTWIGASSRVGNVVAGLGVTPRFYIRHVGEARESENIQLGTGYGNNSGLSEQQAFRIVAWSPGLTGESQRIIESYYTRDGL